MMIKRLFTVFVASYCLVALQAQAPFEASSKEMLRFDVAYLASDLLEGRMTGTQGEQKAAEYIAARLAAMGVAPGGTDGSFYQPFEFELRANPHSNEAGKLLKGQNVVGWIDRGAKHTVVLGAHYDHLGYGGHGSLHTGVEEIHNGADDNASGVAAILMLADRLSQADEYNHFNYLILGFSGEELGLYGSKLWLEHTDFPLENISCMLNFDMVGRLNEERVLVVNGVGTSPGWKESLSKVAGAFQLKTTESGIGASDHSSFYFKDIPAVHFFTGQHSDYHKPKDDAQLVNYEGIEDIVEMVLDLLTILPGDKKLEFTKTKAAQDSREQARFKVTLGVMPDYVFTGEGMRVDGVLDGRPAAKAGMEAGDVIIGIGEHEVKDIYGYMAALAKYEAGDEAEVRFVRKGKEMTLKVVF